MEEYETLIKQDVNDLIIATKTEKDTKTNNELLPDYYKNSDIRMLSQYLEVLKEEYYDVDKFANLFDDIRYFEEANPIVERLHQNLETSMHNKALLTLTDKSDIFKNLLKEYYIIHDVECDLIDSFLELIQKHIDASSESSINYLSILSQIRDNIHFKYSSNIETYTLSFPMSQEEFITKESEYLENMIIRCMYELAKYKNDDLKNDINYAKAEALSIYLQAALLRVNDIRYVDEYRKLSEQIPLDSTAKGIVNTAFVQEKELQKKLVKDDENGMREI